MSEHDLFGLVSGGIGGRGQVWECHSPDRFIGNDDVGPILYFGSDGFELFGDHFDRIARLTLLISTTTVSDLCCKREEGINTWRVSPQQRITPMPPSKAAFVLLATN